MDGLHNQCHLSLFQLQPGRKLTTEFRCCAGSICAVDLMLPTSCNVPECVHFHKHTVGVTVNIYAMNGKLFSGS